MSGSEGVWVVRDADDTLVGIGLSRGRRRTPMSQHELFGGTCAHCATRAARDAAVEQLIDAAREWVAAERFAETPAWREFHERRDAAHAALTQAVAALDGPTVKESLTARTTEESSAHHAARAAGGKHE